jgi:hypothetical protein
MNDAEPREKSWKCLMPPYTPREASAEVAAGFAACDVSRRRFLQLLGVTVGAVAVSGALAACSQETEGEAESSTVAGTTTPPSMVRLSSVGTPQAGGLYDDLLPDFERQTGCEYVSKCVFMVMAMAEWPSILETTLGLTTFFCSGRAVAAAGVAAAVL